ncbi:thiamine pyrophosphokinase [Acanthamoeba castellanii str. Neff]|uniref:Thiamine pyrophosphokinase n=1 Tax=Acanthamoeba castellanii (strain ATCC 30010 / Neff) TaxID=1257118 RepID=L8H7N9_ACACF|nr:thiamine pyrophosphokinase [Acanthamoeba castellanii str. Neff]ELR21529.1 thiamine pyrophosphokinase [Acanthamoeba castellanii str. Neff]
MRRARLWYAWRGRHGVRMMHSTPLAKMPYSLDKEPITISATPAEDVTIWNCADFFATSSTQAMEEVAGRKMEDVPLALIIANSAIPKHNRFFPFLWSKAGVKVCADGGGNRVFAFDKRRFVPDVITGDMDSLRPSVMEYYRSKGTAIVQSRDQDTTDLEKCVLQIKDIEHKKGQTFTNLCVVGGLGGNFSHELANVNILFKYRQRRIFLLSDLNLTFLLVPGRHIIHTNIALRPQDKRRIFCSLVPLGTQCRSITTKGLRWDLALASMEFGGLVSTSNEMAAETAEVEVSDPVLWTFDIRPEEEERRTQRLLTLDDHIDDIRAHAVDHKDEVMRSDVCGCYNCLATFRPSEIKTWTRLPPVGVEAAVAAETAVCPACQRDSVVLGSASGFAVTRDLLHRVKAITS